MKMDIEYKHFAVEQSCTLSLQHGCNTRRFLSSPGLMGLGCTAFSAVFLFVFWEPWRAYQRHMYHNTISMFSFFFFLVSSPQFQLQMFDIVCSLGWTSRDRCCDLPSMVREPPPPPSLPRNRDTGPFNSTCLMRTYVLNLQPTVERCKIFWL